MRINYNVSAMISNNALSNSEILLSKSLERLSSGYKINNAKDNPAGLAMAKRMNAQIEGMSRAGDNANDGISIIETADGALSEIQDMVQRINELAVKASNGVLSDGDRANIQDEVEQLYKEIERIAEGTEFNSQKILNGEFDQKAYTDVEDVKVSDYSDEVTAKKYDMTGVSVTYDPDGNVNSFTAAYSADFPNDIAVAGIKDNQIMLKGSGGFEMKLDLDAVAKKGTTDIGDLTVDATGIGSMRLQIGSNEGQILQVRIPRVSLQNMQLNDLNLTTRQGAMDALSRVTDANQFISSVRSRLGAYQNRLQSTVDSLDITGENMTAAYSRIMDVDMAEEMTSYTTYQVLTQAGTSMLAQANERPSQVLQLLQ
ncbi:MAG TPA: flagellin [Lachnospiraceae bacterium]|nr:flagellin [Lachnospiraceae bacterium]